MAATLPAKLKIPSIQPFATRAAQLQKFRPIISYWCDYYIVNQILSKGLHSADEECKDYTINLMDRLETAKAGGEDAISDDVVAKAYVEQFALETFQRADDAIHTDKASRQTIDTFQAASVFLELLSIWNPLEAETTAKIKYAKYHALRIAKAIKAGEDPNASNPVQEEPSAPEADLGNEMLPPSGSSGIYRPPTVESAPDSRIPSRPASIAPVTPFAQPPPAPAATGTTGDYADVSPIEPADDDTARHNSVGGGYFPSVPTFTSESSAPSMPTAAPDMPFVDPSLTGTNPSVDLSVPLGAATPDPANFYTQQPTQRPAPLQFAHPPPPTAPLYAPTSSAPAQPTVSAPGSYRTDDESIFQAQKHAKWALSALNFEDVPTAVKELKIALQNLGASL